MAYGPQQSPKRRPLDATPCRVPRLFFLYFHSCGSWLVRNNYEQSGDQSWLVILRIAPRKTRLNRCGQCQWLQVWYSEFISSKFMKSTSQVYWCKQELRKSLLIAWRTVRLARGTRHPWTIMFERFSISFSGRQEIPLMLIQRKSFFIWFMRFTSRHPHSFLCVYFSPFLFYVIIYFDFRWVSYPLVWALASVLCPLLSSSLLGWEREKSWRASNNGRPFDLLWTHKSLIETRPM